MPFRFESRLGVGVPTISGWSPPISLLARNFMGSGSRIIYSHSSGRICWPRPFESGLSSGILEGNGVTPLRVALRKIRLLES